MQILIAWKTSFPRFLVPNFCLVRMGFLVWGNRFEDGQFFARVFGLLHSVLGLFSTRDCWCPYSAIGVRETNENRQLLGDLCKLDQAWLPVVTSMWLLLIPISTWFNSTFLRTANPENYRLQIDNFSQIRRSHGCKIHYISMSRNSEKTVSTIVTHFEEVPL